MNTPTDPQETRMLAAYVEAIYFTETGLHEQPTPDVELDPQSYTEALADVRRFIALCAEGDALETAIAQYPERAGHDLWLTRNGHGAGFWDGDWDDTVADRLTELSEEMGEKWSIETDNGLLQVC